MNKDFDEKIKKEIIVLSDLKNLNKNNLLKYYGYWSMKLEKESKEPNKTKQEIESEIKQEIINNIIQYRKESMELYYKIDIQKGKELESTFKQIKLKINFISNPKILRNGKFYAFSHVCFIIYNYKFYNKLYEIKLDENLAFKSVI